MNGIELDAIWRRGDEPPRMVTIVGFEHVVVSPYPSIKQPVLYAVAIPMKGGVPFSAAADQFEVKDKAYREP